MAFKVNHLGKVKSSVMLDPQLLAKLKVQAIKEHLTVGSVWEKALTEYLDKHFNDKTWEESFGQELQSIIEKD